MGHLSRSFVKKPCFRRKFLLLSELITKFGTCQVACFCFVVAFDIVVDVPVVVVVVVKTM